MEGITVIFLAMAILANAGIVLHSEIKIREMEDRLERIEKRYQRLIYGRKID